MIQSLESTWLDAVGHQGFEIRESDGGGPRDALVMPDIATCDECLREVLDPDDRRYRYPFINCTNCGPRFSIIESLPYDREHTSMRRFAMGADCHREYHDPRDRRFHAQPNACPVCGPRLSCWNACGELVAERADALYAAVAAIRDGRIVAVKGLGGFHLMVDAGPEVAIVRLRERKHREEKPLAVMFPDVFDVRGVCQVSAMEERLLTSPERPIVLLSRVNAFSGRIAGSVEPGSAWLGSMLPYTPLPHLLMREIGQPIVATSGNLSDEPICIDEHEALERLAGIADVFLVRDRPIVRHVDDSVARIVAGRELVLRRSRSFAPLPVPTSIPLPPALAVGGQMKNAVAVAVGTNAIISQHIGDLGTAQSTQAFERAIRDLERLYEWSPECVVADLHPDYRSTMDSRSRGLPVLSVQHHHAHVLACMAENEIDGPVLGVSWDGTGYGRDGTVWGGEFLLADGAQFTRFACLRPLQLIGGERAVREPRRTALALWHGLTGSIDGLDNLPIARAFTTSELALLRRMLDRGVNVPMTTSTGRLFDGVAALTGLCTHVSFEGQAAMMLESAVDPGVDGAYLCRLVSPARFAFSGWETPTWVADWGPMVQSIIEAVRGGEAPGAIAARFHAALADLIVAVAGRASRPNVVLSGGCFQNKHLAEAAIERLRAVGFRPYWHQRVPPDDGGLALGQLAFVAHAARGGGLRQAEVDEDAGGLATRGTQVLVEGGT